MMTVREVADRLKCAASTVYQLVETGRLGAFHIGPNGGSIRVSEDQLKQYLEDCCSLPRVPVRKPPRPRLKHIEV